MIQKRRSPGGNRGHAHAGRLGARQVYGKNGLNSTRLPENWRSGCLIPEVTTANVLPNWARHKAMAGRRGSAPSTKIAMPP